MCRNRGVKIGNNKINKPVLLYCRKSNNDVTITRIADIEENVWSPRYGVKGKIDLTVEVKVGRYFLEA